MRVALLILAANLAYLTVLVWLGRGAAKAGRADHERWQR